MPLVAFLQKGTWLSALEGEKIMAVEPKLKDELKKMEYEPLLPVEKQLIGWSIVIGVILLGFLVWVSYAFFPGGAGH